MSESVLEAPGTLLWTNPNPGQAFGAETVYLDLSRFRRIKVTFMPFHSLGELGCSEIVKGATGQLFYMFFNTGTATDARTFMNGVTRACTPTSDRVVFGNGQMVYAGNAYPNWDNRAVPYQIFGVQ